MTLTAFLLARLNEDRDWLLSHGECFCDDFAYHRPDCLARMRDQCEANWLIVNLHRATDSGHFCATCSDGGPFYENGGLEYPCPTLRALAPIWNTHADYRDEWAD